MFSILYSHIPVCLSGMPPLPFTRSPTIVFVFPAAISPIPQLGLIPKEATYRLQAILAGHTSNFTYSSAEVSPGFWHIIKRALQTPTSSETCISAVNSFSWKKCSCPSTVKKFCWLFCLLFPHLVFTCKQASVGSKKLSLNIFSFLNRTFSPNHIQYCNT